jgi:hypothetical protein
MKPTQAEFAWKTPDVEMRKNDHRREDDAYRCHQLPNGGHWGSCAEKSSEVLQLNMRSSGQSKYSNNLN